MFNWTDFLIVTKIIYTNPYVIVGYIALLITHLIERRYEIASYRMER